MDSSASGSCRCVIRPCTASRREHDACRQRARVSRRAGTHVRFWIFVVLPICPFMSAAERMRGLVEADPVVILEIAGAIANDGEGRWPPDEVTAAAADHVVRL